MSNKHLSEAEDRMKKAVDSVKHEVGGVRTGKASAGLLDTVRVEAYGSHVPLQQVANVTAPEPRLIVVQPWDKGLIKAVMKGITEAQLGLNPTDDSNIVRIPVPTLTEERRKELAKLIAKFAEEGRVHIRQIRHDVNKAIKDEEGSGVLPADDAKRLTADAQKLTDKYTGLIDELLKKKTAEVLEV